MNMCVWIRGRGGVGWGLGVGWGPWAACCSSTLLDGACQTF